MRGKSVLYSQSVCGCAELYRFLLRQIRHWQQQPVRRILFLFLQQVSRFVMAFLFESIVGTSVLSLCISLFTPHSMNGSAGSRVFCALIY